MIRDKIAQEFYIEDHALIYGLLGKYAQEVCPETWEAAFAAGTVQYARERGVRMAKRCLADGRPLNMQTYLLYGEWADTRGATSIQVSGIVPRFTNTVPQCAWNDAWKKHDLLPYGAIYCTLADKNLVRGFSPAETVEITDLLTHGAASCEFDWIGASFRTEQEFYDLMALKQQLAPYTMKDFLYHSGHVLSALRRVFYTELGVAETEAICGRALAAFSAVMGEEKRAALEEEAKLDFFAV
ncbi:MAG: L-2-amino-thiazoline-4-carboxylic acid hydrolase [Oscillibacter sp.]|nr:L-2-amino-thiazoline-4-carboxylic acid hydrolase [Oscillibacter sp.]